MARFLQKIRRVLCPSTAHVVSIQKGCLDGFMYFLYPAAPRSGLHRSNRVYPPPEAKSSKSPDANFQELHQRTRSRNQG